MLKYRVLEEPCEEEMGKDREFLATRVDRLEKLMEELRQFVKELQERLYWVDGGVQ